MALSSSSTPSWWAGAEVCATGVPANSGASANVGIVGMTTRVSPACFAVPLTGLCRVCASGCDGADGTTDAAADVEVLVWEGGALAAALACTGALETCEEGVPVGVELGVELRGDAAGEVYDGAGLDGVVAMSDWLGWEVSEAWGVGSGEGLAAGEGAGCGAGDWLAPAVAARASEGAIRQSNSIIPSSTPPTPARTIEAPRPARAGRKAAPLRKQSNGRVSNRPPPWFSYFSLTKTHHTPLAEVDQ